MKTVFTNAQYAHVWAQQTQLYGHSGNTSFLNDVFYSYGTPIARIIKRKGKRILLVTSCKYSVTTEGKHKNAVRHAFGYDAPSYSVPSLGISGGRHFEKVSSKPDHRFNLEHLVADYHREIKRLERARVYFERIRARLQPLANAVNSYAELFGFKLRVKVMPEVMRLESLESIAAWRAGTIHSLFGISCRDMHGGALIRLKGTDTLQTSLGAEVPLEAARNLYDHAVLARRACKIWFPQVVVSVGNFRLDHIDADGSVHVGCHKIAWPEIEAFAAVHFTSNEETR